MMVKRGQAGTEFLMLFAVLSAALLVVSYLFYANFQVQSASFQARIAVDRIADAVNAVAAQGAGSNKSISVYLPPRIVNLTARGREVAMTISGSNGVPSDVFQTTLTNLTFYQFPLSEGKYLFYVWLNANGNVSISR